MGDFRTLEIIEMITSNPYEAEALLLRDHSYLISAIEGPAYQVIAPDEPE